MQKMAIWNDKDNAVMTDDLVPPDAPAPIAGMIDTNDRPSKSPVVFVGMAAFRDLYAPSRQQVTAMPDPTEAPPQLVVPVRPYPRRLTQTLASVAICLFVIAAIGEPWAGGSRDRSGAATVWSRVEAPAPPAIDEAAWTDATDTAPIVVAPLPASEDQPRLEAATEPLPALERDAMTGSVEQPLPSASGRVERAAPAAVPPGPRTIALVLDSSSRMAEASRVGGPTRWEIMDAALETTLNTDMIGEDTLVGIVAFGQGGCSDVATLQAPEPYVFERAFNAMYDLEASAMGSASLGAALRAATTASGEFGPVELVVVTAGADDCGDELLAATADWSGVAGRRLSVVAVAPSDAATVDQLRALASAGHGDYVEADNAADLAAMLQAALAEAANRADDPTTMGTP